MRRLIYLLVILAGCTVSSQEVLLDGSSPEAWQTSIEEAMAEMSAAEKQRFQSSLTRISLEKVGEGKSNEEILRELDGTPVRELLGG